jgi:hypothetical protein
VTAYSDEMLAAFPTDFTMDEKGRASEDRRARMTVEAKAAADALGREPEVAGRTAFITGGASGIGLGMAKVFARAGMRARGLRRTCVPVTVRAWSKSRRAISRRSRQRT